MHPLTSKRKALTLATILFLIGLAILIVTDAWWPGIMLAVGLPLSLRQYLLGRSYDTMVSLFVFVGTYISVDYDISWRVLLPVLFTLGAIYILCREFFGPEEMTEEEKEEELNHEIEETRKPKK